MFKKCVKKVSLSITLALLIGINVVEAADCDGLFTAEAYEFIREILGYITIAIPVLLVILCASDLAAVVIAQDDSVAKKAAGRIAKRFIAGAAVFFVPLIVRVVLGLEPVKESLNLVDDPLCGIGESQPQPDQEEKK